MNRTTLVDERGHEGIIVGAGAQGRVTAAVWQRAEPELSLMFLDDAATMVGTTVAEIPVVDCVSALKETRFRRLPAIIGVGSNPNRARLGRMCRDLAASFINVIDPSAVIMPNASFGVGIFVGPMAVVHARATIGDHVIINTGAIVEHDAILEEGASVAPGVKMGGRVLIGRQAFVSTGATILPRVTIGAAAIVGAGAVVTRDIPPQTLAYGFPAQIVREVDESDWPRLL